MEKLNIAILDDDKDKITNLKTLFIKQQDKSSTIYDGKYSDYTLELTPINVEQTPEEIIDEITLNKFDAIIIDYDLSSYATTSNNGVSIANQIKEKFSEYPLFILTAFEERLFQNEIFDAYQIYNYDNHLNDDKLAKEFISHLIQQILKSRKQIEIWEKELRELSLIPKEEQNIDIISRIIELDNKIEKSIDGISALSPKLKEDLYTNKLDNILKKVDELLEEESRD